MTANERPKQYRVRIVFRDGVEKIGSFPYEYDKDGTPYLMAKVWTGRPDRPENVWVKLEPATRFRTGNAPYVYHEVTNDD